MSRASYVVFYYPNPNGTASTVGYILHNLAPLRKSICLAQEQSIRMATVWAATDNSI